MRLGSTNRAADPALIAQLSRRIGVEGFGQEPLADLDSEAIDFGAASQCFAERRPLRRKDLETLGLVRRAQGRTVPTAGGILLFGWERLARLPDAHTQAGRFAGTHRAHLADDRIDVENPGILLPGLTLNDLRDGISRARRSLLEQIVEGLLRARHAGGRHLRRGLALPRGADGKQRALVGGVLR